MRQLLCLLLIVPGLAMAGQETALRPAAVQSATRLQAGPRPLASAGRHDIGGGGTANGTANGTASGTAIATPTRGRIIAEPAALCEAAAAAAEVAGRLPSRLLHAISLVESGRADGGTGMVRAWPWTINAEGEGYFFDTQQQAIAAVEALQARGVRSIDVGCMQVNLMYHPHAFATLRDAFDPCSNAAYAARFLNALFADTRDWPRAIAAYHSETPALGEAYRTLVMARWQNPDMLRPVGGLRLLMEPSPMPGRFTARSSPQTASMVPSRRDSDRCNHTSGSVDDRFRPAGPRAYPDAEGFRVCCVPGWRVAARKTKTISEFRRKTGISYQRLLIHAHGRPTNPARMPVDPKGR